MCTHAHANANTGTHIHTHRLTKTHADAQIQMIKDTQINRTSYTLSISQTCEDTKNTTTHRCETLNRTAVVCIEMVIDKQWFVFPCWHCNVLLSSCVSLLCFCPHPPFFFCLPYAVPLLLFTPPFLPSSLSLPSSIPLSTFHPTPPLPPTVFVTLTSPPAAE